MKRGLIFDLDGTLWDSSGVIRPLWNEILAAHGREPLDEAAFGGLMGLTKAEIAARLFPTKPEEERLAVMDECFFAEQKLLRRVGARLYPGLRETLEALRGAYGLYIVSNCAPAYLEAFFEAHGLRELFDDWETHGGTGLPQSGSRRRNTSFYKTAFRAPGISETPPPTRRRPARRSCPSSTRLTASASCRRQSCASAGSTSCRPCLLLWKGERIHDDDRFSVSPDGEAQRQET